MNLDNNAPYIFTIETVLTTEECNQLIELIEKNNPKPAPINTLFGEKHKPDVRNNDRFMLNDQSLANKVYLKIKNQLPPQVFDYQIHGLNELFRCYRYKPGMRFAPHSDGAYQRSKNERSFYTFLIYLNDVETSGETKFYVEPELSFQPKTGFGLLFQHPIVHEGCEVLSGVKYVIRTDVMYRKKSQSIVEDESLKSINRHIQYSLKN